MAVAQSKNNGEIKKVVYSEPSDWTPYKDPVTGWTGYKSTSGTSTTVTVKWKDGSPDQTHSMPTGGTVQYANGFVHFSN